MASGQVDFSSPAEAVGSDLEDQVLGVLNGSSPLPFMTFSSATRLGVTLFHNSELCDQFCLDTLKSHNLSKSCNVHSVRPLNSLV